MAQQETLIRIINPIGFVHNVKKMTEEEVEQLKLKELQEQINNMNMIRESQEKPIKKQKKTSPTKSTNKSKRITKNMPVSQTEDNPKTSEDILIESFDAVAGMCKYILRTKGKEYSKEADRFSNFKSCAEEAGISVQKAWLVFFKKHCDAIYHFCRSGHTESEETIDSRIFDAINYLVMLYTMKKLNILELDEK